MKYHIPRYVYVLLDRGEKDKLHKVLIIDYIDNFLAKNSVIKRLDNKIMRTMKFIVRYMSLIFFSSAVMGTFGSIILVLYSLIVKNGEGAVKELAGMLVFIIVGIAGIFMLKSNKHMEDDYTINKKHINKIINNRLKRYDKEKDKYNIL